MLPSVQYQHERKKLFMMSIKYEGMIRETVPLSGRTIASSSSPCSYFQRP